VKDSHRKDQVIRSHILRLALQQDSSQVAKDQAQLALKAHFKKGFPKVNRNAQKQLIKIEVKEAGSREVYMTQKPFLHNNVLNEAKQHAQYNQYTKA